MLICPAKEQYHGYLEGSIEVDKVIIVKHCQAMEKQGVCELDLFSPQLQSFILFCGTLYYKEELGKQSKKIA